MPEEELKPLFATEQNKGLPKGKPFLLPTIRDYRRHCYSQERICKQYWRPSQRMVEVDCD